MNVTLYGKIGLLDMKDLETRSSWIIQMGSKSNDRCLYERKAEGDLNTWRKRSCKHKQRLELCSP